MPLPKPESVVPGVNGTLNENDFFNFIDTDVGDNLAAIDELAAEEDWARISDKLDRVLTQFKSELEETIADMPGM